MRNDVKQTLHNKIDSLTERLSKCRKELKALKKEHTSQTSSTCPNCNAFRNAMGCVSTAHKHKKRRLNRARTPNNFYDIDSNF